MPVNDFTAAPTATTFHGVEISANMKLSYSPHEKNCFFAHIIKHQLTKFAADFHLNELHQALGIANMGQKYTEMIYPKILDALKIRIRTLQSHHDKDFRPFAKAVIEDGRLRFYAKFMDAWAEPQWQGNMVKPPEQKDQVQEAPPPQPPTQLVPSINSHVPPVSLQPSNPAVQQNRPEPQVAWSPPIQPPASQPTPVIERTSAQLASSQPASVTSRVVKPSPARSPLVRSQLAQSHLTQRAPAADHTQSQPPPVQPPSAQQSFAEPRLFQSHLTHYPPPVHQTPIRQAAILPHAVQPGAAQGTSTHWPSAHVAARHSTPEHAPSAQLHLQYKPSQHHSSFDNGPHTPPVSPSGHLLSTRDFLSRARGPPIPPSPQSPSPGQLNAAGLQTSQSTPAELHHQSSPSVNPTSQWVQPLRRAGQHQAATAPAPEDHHHVFFHRRHGCLQELLELRVQALRLTADLTRNSHLRDYLSLVHQLDAIRDRRAQLLDVVVDTTRGLQAHGPAHVSFLAFRL